MTDLSILIPARNEMFLAKTIENILENIEADTEVIAVCDGNWPDPPIKDHPRVTLIHHAESIGQRAATNEAARLSQAKFIMKVDAHCAFDKGFDVKMMADCEYTWTAVPRMRNLHAFDWLCEKCGHRQYQGPTPDKCPECGGKMSRDILWKAKERPISDFMRFDKDLHFQYWSKYRKRTEAKGDICDQMCCIGACWMMHRERYWELDGMDEAHGSWGQMGVEIACKTWLSGGRQIVNKKTWFAHMFRTQGGDFGFPYPNPGVSRARKHSRNLWLNDKWDKAVHPFSWLIDKFAPIPDWHDAPPKVGVVYYTDNTGDQALMETCRQQLKQCVNGHEIVTVSQKPLDFGKNFVMDIGRSNLSIFKQILKGLEESTADIVFLCEHDLLYHPSHFNFIPPKKDVFYYDRNRWSVCDKTGKAVFYHTNVPSMLCAYRELLLKHYRRRVELTEKEGFKSSLGYSPPKGIPKEERGKYECYMSEVPSIDIRRDDAWTRKRMDKSQFRSDRGRKGWTETDEVPGWGVTANRFDEFIMELGQYNIPGWNDL